MNLAKYGGKVVDEGSPVLKIDKQKSCTPCTRSVKKWSATAGRADIAIGGGDIL